MWNFEKMKEDIAGLRDWFSLKYKRWDFLAKSKEDEEKEIIQIFFKQKFIDELVSFKSDIKRKYPLYIVSISIFEIFEEIWVLLVPKTILSNGVVSWFSCYDVNLKKMFDTDWVYWEFNYKYWKIYFHEVFKNNTKNLWKQFAIDRDWMRETWEKIKIFSDWDIYRELNNINKDINKEWLYSIYLGKGQSRDRIYYTWEFFILLKEILNTTKDFFLDEYTIKLEECRDLLDRFFNNYSIVITNEIKIDIKWEKKISQEKYIEFQKLILTNFPQLLDVKYKGNDDISDNYCSFFLRIENDWKISNLQQIQHLFHTFAYVRPLNFNSSKGITIIYPRFPVLLKDKTDNWWETNDKTYEIQFITGTNKKWNYLSLKKNDIIFSFLNDESSYIRKFFEEKDTNGTKNNYNITFFVWMESLEKKYWRWIYILEIKNNENLRFLREDWTIVFSIDNFPISKTFSISEVYPNPYNIKFNEKTWNCFFVDMFNSRNKDFLYLNLLNFKFKLLKDKNCSIEDSYSYDEEHCFDQYFCNKKNGRSIFFKPSLSIIEINSKGIKEEYIIWMDQNNLYFERNWIKWTNYIIKECKNYRLIIPDFIDESIKISEDDILYWDINWNWFLSLLYSIRRDSWILRTTFNKPIFVNDNLKIWFFIPLAFYKKS